MTQAQQQQRGSEARNEEPAAEAIEIVDLTKNYGSFTALDSVSLTIHDGELICFLGPSGCGKTTLLRTIAGLEDATSGIIRQNGTDVTHLPTAMRDFGIVFQSYALFPNLTIGQNVGYGLANMKWPKAKIVARVTELLEMIGLPGSEDKFPAQMSGGQQQRVALARALANSPSLLLLDEPLSALDAQVRVHLRQQIRDLQRQFGVTTVMVTHDQEEALTMADRIVVIDHGVIKQVGTPEELYGAPANEFVAKFIGSMNVMSGQIETSGQVALGHAHLACDTGQLAHGAKVTVCIRPENIEVRPDDHAQGPNSAEAEILDIEFLGLSYRLVLELTDAPEVKLEVNLTRTAFADRDRPKPGDTIKIGLPPTAISLFESAS